MEGDVARRLYALALRLVPEANAAGDLFMAARDEADLRRRAARWRRRHGLPAEPAEPWADLPVLDPEQQAYADHLAGRAARRRAQRPWLIGLGVALLAGALGLARFTVFAPPTGLAADTHFHGAPLATSGSVAGMRLQVYRAEATAGTVTFWWSVQGPGASRLGSDLAARLFGQSPGGGPRPPRGASDAAPFRQGQELWREPVRLETAAVQGDRLLGRSVFRLAGLGRNTALFDLHRLSDPGYDWSLQVRLTAVVPDPAARTLPVGQKATVGAATVTLESIDLAPDYLAVRFTAPGRMGAGLPRQGVVVEAGEVRLGAYDAWRPAGGTVVALFEPPPAGADSLRITFTGFGLLAEPAVIPLPAPDLLSEWHQADGQVTAVLTPPPVERLLGPSFLTDAEGWRYNVSLRPLPQPAGSFRLQAVGVPADAHLVSLSLGYMRRIEPPSFTVNLRG